MDKALEQWATVIDVMDLPISVHDRDFVVRLANRAFLERVGAEAGDVLGCRCHNLAHCTDEPVAGCPHQALLREGLPMEREFISPDGERATGVSCFPIHGADGSVVGSVHMIRDVTELVNLRTRQERQNNEIAGYLRTLVSYMGEFSANTGSPIPFENDHIKPCWTILECKDPKCAVREAATPRCWHVPGPHACTRGEINDPVERLAACHHCPAYVAATPDDITALTESFNDLVFLLREKEQQLMRTERLAVLGDLGAMLAHEMRSPLNSLGIGAQRLHRRARGGEDLPATEVRERTGAILSDIRRLDAVIEGFLNSVDRRRPPSAKAPLATMVQDACGGARYEASRRGVELALECSGGQVRLPGRLAESIGAVLFHLLLNAIEAVPEGGRVAVTCSYIDGKVDIRVDDNGPGVPADLREKVFEPFFTTKKYGTGLGLASAAQSARRFGGDITVERSALGGASFRLRLPVPREGA